MSGFEIIHLHKSSLKSNWLIVFFLLPIVAFALSLALIFANSNNQIAGGTAQTAVLGGQTEVEAGQPRLDVESRRVDNTPIH